jgi:hypothetical protein
MKLEFSQHIFEKSQISSFIEIRLVGADLFHADGRTAGHDKANSCFLQFCECAKNGRSTSGTIIIDPSHQ